MALGHHTFWLAVEFLKVYVQNPWWQQYNLSNSLRPLTQYTGWKLGKYFSPPAYPFGIFAAIMKPYKNMKVKVHSTDGDIYYFDIVAGVLQWDTLSPYLFIIFFDNVLNTSIGLMKENSSKLAKERSRRYPTQKNCRRGQRQWNSASGKYTHPSRNRAA